MSDFETKYKRNKRLTIRNRHAKALKEDSYFKIRRVESDRKQYERLTTSEWLKRINQKDDENDE